MIPDLIMLDIETLGVAPTAQLLQIGAVNILKPHLDFKIEISIDSQQDYFATASMDTLDFWQGLPEEVRKRVLCGQTHVKDALLLFARWLPKNARLFCHGASFDFPILHHHYHLNGLEVPWNYRDLRCFRTIYAQHREHFAKAMAEIAHDALSDAKAQAQVFRAIYEAHPEIAL